MSRARALSVQAIQQAQAQQVLRNLRGTVGVAPGTYTLQLGAPMVCPPDGWGTGAYGVPRVGWYDLPNNWYGISPPKDANAAYHLLDPYGTDSRLMGLRDVAPTFAGIRLDVLGAMLGVITVAAIGIGFIASR